MNIGDGIEIKRLESGLYRVVMPDGTVLIGGAASTAIALINAVLKEEAEGNG